MTINDLDFQHWIRMKNTCLFVGWFVGWFVRMIAQKLLKILNARIDPIHSWCGSLGSRIFFLTFSFISQPILHAWGKKKLPYLHDWYLWESLKKQLSAILVRQVSHISWLMQRSVQFRRELTGVPLVPYLCSIFLIYTKFTPT